MDTMTVTLADLTTDARSTPLGIDTLRPVFAWKLRTEARDARQTGYAVQVATSATFGSDTVWDSGAVASDLPFGARYTGPVLRSRQRYWWRVQITGVAGTGTGAEFETDWSPATWFETALLDQDLWKARWIGGPPPASRSDDPVLYLRGRLDLAGDVVGARAYVSALGWYRLFVNGQDLTGDALVPRWTPFSAMVEYQTYDVTDALRTGRNILAIAVGDGRYRGALGLLGARESYGNRIGALAQFEIHLADGTTVTAITDEHWLSGPGRITGSDPKHGERTDLRISDADWLDSEVTPGRFAPAQVLPDQRHQLVAEEVARVQAVDRLQARVSRAPSGAQLLDFGQNFSGVVRLRLAGPSGAQVQLTHGELLTTEGELDTRSFVLGKGWYQRETVTLAGAEQWYQPWFTIHGFRYAEVTGLGYDLRAEDVEGIVLSSDLARTGTFTCSDPRLERLHQNVLWSVRSNFTDTPTDCPTRERSGWTGDIQVFAPTASVLVDSHAFLDRYLRNLAAEQFEDGVVPQFIPSEQPIGNGLGRTAMRYLAQSTGWSDAAVLLPWTVYRYYGDRNLLERQYDSMRRWVDRSARMASKGCRPGILNRGFHFGEWLRPGEKPLPTIARHVFHAPAEIATAYLAHSADVLSQVANVLGHDLDAARYGEVHRRSRDAWCAAYMHPDGRLALDRQDDYVRALAFDLIPADRRPAAVQRLVDLVTAAGGHLATGFLSTSMLLPVLVDGGRADVALDLLFQTTNPSWLYQVEHGATTVWETWEGYDEKGQGKESHNHYALGAVAGWLTEGLAGLMPAAPGYRHLRVAPVLTDRLTHVEASLETPFGTASSGWRRHGGTITLEVQLPPGVTAEVDGPWTVAGGGPTAVLGSGHHVLKTLD